MVGVTNTDPLAAIPQLNFPYPAIRGFDLISGGSKGAYYISIPEIIITDGTNTYYTPTIIFDPPTLPITPPGPGNNPPPKVTASGIGDINAPRQTSNWYTTFGIVDLGGSETGPNQQICGIYFDVPIAQNIQAVGIGATGSALSKIQLAIYKANILANFWPAIKQGATGDISTSGGPQLCSAALSLALSPGLYFLLLNSNDGLTNILGVLSNVYGIFGQAALGFPASGALPTWFGDGTQTPPFSGIAGGGTAYGTWPGSWTPTWFSSTTTPAFWFQMA